MKKVFLSLALVVALSVSFVSCKDTKVETPTEEVVAPTEEVEVPAVDSTAVDTTVTAPAETPAQ